VQSQTYELANGSTLTTYAVGPGIATVNAAGQWSICSPTLCGGRNISGFPTLPVHLQGYMGLVFDGGASEPVGLSYVITYPDGTGLFSSGITLVPS
jgi:hypothetical protein